MGPSFGAASPIGGHVTYEQMREAVASCDAATQTADAFRRAFGLPIRASKPKRQKLRDRTDYEKLMRQRYGVMVRAR